MKVALIHDWLTGMRGGEKVLLELLRLLPSADLLTLLWNRGSVLPEIESRIRGTSFLDKLPRKHIDYRYLLPLFPAAVRSLDLGGYDLIVSSSHAFAKCIRVPPAAKHVSYVHTPVRYIWDLQTAYFEFGSGRTWKRVCLTAIAPWLRRFDRRTSSGVDLFIANSRNVKERIRRAYAADAVVVPPPVDTDFFTPDFNSQPGDFYLVVSSLEPYKRIDLAIDALGRSGKRLLVAGDGTLAQQLRRSARPSVEFLGRVSDERLRDLFRHSKALIFPGVEDFGIVPVEAQACGKPVICYARGGALETVIDGTTGIYFHEQTQQVLLDAVERCESTEWDARTIRAQSLRFTRSLFHIRMKAILREVAGHSLQFHEHAGGTILHAGA